MFKTKKELRQEIVRLENQNKLYEEIHNTDRRIIEEIHKEKDKLHMDIHEMRQKELKVMKLLQEQQYGSIDNLLNKIRTIYTDKRIDSSKKSVK